MLTKKGREYIASSILDVSGTIPFDFSNTYIGVGTSSVPPIDTNEDLLGSHKERKAMDVGYPKISKVDPSIMIFRASFEQFEANFAWEEWGIFNGNQSDSLMLVREVESVGIKEVGNLWRFTVSVKLLTAYI